MITLFIDTNVLLSFYHLTSEDIEELKKLVVLVNSKEISLIVPKQVENEFWRNRGNKISDAMKKLRGANFVVSFPAFSKDYNEYDELRALLKKSGQLHTELVNKIVADAQKTSLKADDVVKGLFASATKPNFDDGHYWNAVKRVRLGNPPGKKESLGDAVNWETLLASVKKGVDLYFVSEDKDYGSQLTEGAFNEFLRDEWDSTKKSSLFYYSKISDFFKDKFPKIKIASQIEVDLAINSLSNSSSFATTHAHIAKLNTFDQFTNAQIERLIKIPAQNNQVALIIADTDVHEFYAKVLDKYGRELGKADYDILFALVQTGDPKPRLYDPPL